MHADTKHQVKWKVLETQYTMIPNVLNDLILQNSEL